MTDTISGHIIGGPAEVKYHQAALTTALAIGDTVLHVDDPADFDENATERDAQLVLGIQMDGEGNLDLSAATYLPYKTYDDDARTIELVNPSTVAADAGDVAYVQNPVDGTIVGTAEVMVAIDDADTTGDPLPAQMDVGLLDLVGDQDLTDQAVELELDDDDQLIVVGLPGLAAPVNDVKFDQDGVIAEGPGIVVLLLKYLPIKNSEHLYWNGQYRSGFKWSRDGYVVTIYDPLGLIKAGHAFWMEYAYKDPTPRPELTMTSEIPGRIATFNFAGSPTSGIHSGASPASGAVSTQDDDESYIKIVGTPVTVGVTGWFSEIKFDPFGIPGTLETTELVVSAKGPDSRTATAGQTSPNVNGLTALLSRWNDDGSYIDSWNWFQVGTETTDGTYVVTVTPLQKAGAEYVTKEMVQAGSVGYSSPGSGLNLGDTISGGSPDPSIAYEQHITYVALRVTYTVPAWDGIPENFSTDDGSYDPVLDIVQLDPAVGTGGGGGGSSTDVYREVLMASGVSGPPEPLETSAGGDWLYGIPGGS